jgi:hypothetical protein
MALPGKQITCYRVVVHLTAFFGRTDNHMAFQIASLAYVLIGLFFVGFDVVHMKPYLAKKCGVLESGMVILRIKSGAQIESEFDQLPLQE